MSERERWIVYPLLFLALGASLRDKLIKQTLSDKVICEELYCERVLSDEIYVSQGPRYTRVLEGNTLKISNVQADRLFQSGQQVLSLGPQLLQVFKTLGIWTPAAGTPPPSPGGPSQPAPQP